MTDPNGSTMPETPPATQEPAAAAPADPPWGKPEEFDPEKAWSRIQQQSRDIDKLRTQLTDAAPKLTEYDRLVEQNKTGEQRREDALKAAQEVATASAAQIAAYQDRTVRAEIRAAASDRFVDADVPFAYLDSKKYVTTDGDIDQAAIQADLTDLLANKPGLAKPTGARLPGPNPAQGGGANGGPTLDDQMAAAVKAGDTREQIRIQNQKLAALPR